MTTREQVVAEAKTWCGTPYHPCAMVKGAGVDCGMILVGVYQACGLIPADFKPEPYPPDWHMHRNEEVFLGYMLRFGREISRDEAGPGDAMLWRYARTFSHGAIIVDWPVVVHACERDGMVVMADASRDSSLTSKRHPVRFFTPRGLHGT